MLNLRYLFALAMFGVGLGLVMPPTHGPVDPIAYLLAAPFWGMSLVALLWRRLRPQR